MKEAHADTLSLNFALNFSDMCLFELTSLPFVVKHQWLEFTGCCFIFPAEHQELLGSPQLLNLNCFG